MRRTKEDSELTRQHILAAARREFANRGVTRTTLEHIAAAAGVTRGAIYWHFKNKSELFRAMRDQVTLPLVDRTEFALTMPPGTDALDTIERFMCTLVENILEDRDTCRTFEILNLKCEYVDEMKPELVSQAKRCGELIALFRARYTEAAEAGALRPRIVPDVAALESAAFVIGLLRMSLLGGERAPIRGRARELIASHVASRRCT